MIGARAARAGPGGLPRADILRNGGSQVGDVILKLNNLTKNYPGVIALDNVSFEVERGSVHAICGENGAGKSTLIKILTGAITPSSGSIEFKGNTYTKLTPRQALDMGISVIYQEFSLIPQLTVVENIFYGCEIKKGLFRDVPEMERRTRELCQQMGINIDVNKRVCDLGIAWQQIVEILKAVSKNAELVIMDEPTAPLTVKETDVFFNIVKKMREENITIIFISHRLEEVFEICDDVTVLCDGRYINTRKVADITKRDLITSMVGRELSDTYPAPNHEPGEVIMKVDHLVNNRVHDVSFELRRGEILGFGGLVGAGRTELARAIFGADPIQSGTITYDGKPYVPKSPTQSLKTGIGLIPEDRKAQGVVLSLTIRENIVYSILDKVSKAGIVNRESEKKQVDYYVDKLEIKTPSVKQLVAKLSGGNQQKVVLARVLATDCDVLIFDEPTRGIDVGAKSEIYELMRALADEGKAIIMISSEMPELIGMSDRILVMSNGYLCQELKRGEYDQATILEIASSRV